MERRARRSECPWGWVPQGQSLYYPWSNVARVPWQLRSSGKSQGHWYGGTGGISISWRLALRNEYETWTVPRNVKKSVQRSSRCEMQGATIDGVAGLAFPRETKLAKYFGLALFLCQAPRATLKQWQVTCGGLVYFTMFRRPLLGTLNRVWSHMESYHASQGKSQLSPKDCKLEALRFLGLLPLARLDFRLDMRPLVTCSDASTKGGGACVSTGLTAYGAHVASGSLRGENAESRTGHAVLSIGLFDGIGALRVALEALEVTVLGHVSVESNPAALLGAGPPCQGVSGLNADRKGALKDARSCLFTHVARVRDLLRRVFTWCPVHYLMESVRSMDSSDRRIMSTSVGTTPVQCDAGALSWCHRPRLYWFSWDIVSADDATIEPSGSDAPDILVLHAEQSLNLVLKQGWLKVQPDRAFPTFTTSRPRATAGRKPAGVQQCSAQDLRRWQSDKHRFPPYQYVQDNCVVNKHNEFRIPDVSEREVMLGFPLHYTAPCANKSGRSGEDYMDTRLTLLGNTWSVPVVAWILGQLFTLLGFIGPRSVQSVVDSLSPGATPSAQGRLVRLPLNPWRSPGNPDQYDLAFKLGNLISIKGEDLLLTTPTSQLVKYQRLRASVPKGLWKWRVLAGWKWRGQPEHINVLELRAVLTSIRWRLEHQGHIRTRLIHLTDNLVCLHALTRGRSSSRKLRRTMSRINALILASGTQPLWGYIATDQNPADRPSRWGQRVRTKFRKHAA